MHVMSGGCYVSVMSLWHFPSARCDQPTHLHVLYGKLRFITAFMREIKSQMDFIRSFFKLISTLSLSVCAAVRGRRRMNDTHVGFSSLSARSHGRLITSHPSGCLAELWHQLARLEEQNAEP